MTTFPSLPQVPPGTAPMVNFLQAVRAVLTQLTSPAPYQLPSYSVAQLPANGPGLVAYAYDGRKNGETAGNGSGVMIFSDTTKWCACDTGQVVAK